MNSATGLAKLTDYRSACPRILCGEYLSQVQEIETSILEFGLVKPLVVSSDGTHLVVIDGRKRLAALRRLRFRGKLPGKLKYVPYCHVIHNSAQDWRLEIAELIKNTARTRAA